MRSAIRPTTMSANSGETSISPCRSRLCDEIKAESRWRDDCDLVKETTGLVLRQVNEQTCKFPVEIACGRLERNRGDDPSDFGPRIGYRPRRFDDGLAIDITGPFPRPA